MPSTTLTWTNHATYDTVHPERADAGGTFAELSPGGIAGNLQIYQDLSPLAGNTYGYRVRGKAGGLFSNYSNVWWITLSGGAPVDSGAYRAQFFGWGTDTVGGRGPGGITPKIIRVNTLSDSGAPLQLNGDGTYSGELRAACLASGPRYVVFEVSGYITLNSGISIFNPYLTIAGQTAPSPGITVRFTGAFGQNQGTKEFIVATHDCVFQHFRVRPGNLICNSAFQVWNFDNGAIDVYNIVFDHMSVSWTIDEGITFVTNAHMGTIWRSIVAECLFNTPGAGECAQGGQLGGDGIGVGTGSQIAILQNLIAHNQYRNPQIGGSGSGALQNNLVSGCGSNGPWWGTQPGNGAFNWRADGNYFKQQFSLWSSAMQATATVSGSQLYLNDNVLDDNGFGFTEFNPVTGVDPTVGSPGIAVPGYTPLSGAATYASVLANAGARPLDRDAVDTRIVQEVNDRDGIIVASVNDVGGYPALAQNTRAFMVPESPHSIANGQTFRTNIEMTLENDPTFGALVLE